MREPVSRSTGTVLIRDHSTPSGLIVAFIVAICVSVFTIWAAKAWTREYPTEQPFINAYEQKIDSLNALLLDVTVQRDSFLLLAAFHAQKAEAKERIIYQKFNADEKAKRIVAVSMLSDSASFEYFSKWVSESDN